MSYIVLTASSTIRLQQSVMELLARGWSLQGGVSVAMDQGQTEYAQAMTF